MAYRPIGYIGLLFTSLSPASLDLPPSLSAACPALPSLSAEALLAIALHGAWRVYFAAGVAAVAGLFAAAAVFDPSCLFYSVAVAAVVSFLISGGLVEGFPWLVDRRDPA